MENEEILRQFEEIENKVEKLIGQCKSLEANNLQLADRVKELEQELEQKAEAENHHAEEKTFIRSKIDNLLSKLKDI